MVLDSADDVIVTGRMNVTGRGDEFETLKIANADGTILWESRDGGAARLDDRGLDVAIGADDCPVVTGLVQNADGTATQLTIKYDGSDGGALWTCELPGMVNDLSGDGWVEIDPAGDVVVCCKLWSSSTSYDVRVAKLSGADGTVLWSTDWTNGNAMDDPADMTLTAGGDPVVVGVTAGDYLTLRLSGADGSTVWWSTYNGPPGWYDVAGDVSVADTGEILVTGFSDGSGTSWDIATIGYDPADGAENWVVRYDGPAHQSDEGRCVLLAPDHRLYVVGYSYSEDAGMDQIVLAYDHSPTIGAGDVPSFAVSLQAAPNPFNPAVTLTADLERELPVRLEVRDLRGRLVRMLADGPRAAGLHRWRWDGRDEAGRLLPSGIYLARLSAGGATRVTKLVLAR